MYRHNTVGQVPVLTASHLLVISNEGFEEHLHQLVKVLIFFNNGTTFLFAILGIPYSMETNK